MEDEMLAIDEPVADNEDIGLNESPRDAYGVEVPYYYLAHLSAWTG